MKLREMTIVELNEAIRKNDASIEDIAKDHLAGIKETEPKLDAFLDVYEDDVLQRAQDLDLNREEAVNNLLFGIPCSLKDIFLLEGKRATGGSKILENYVASYTATSVSHLQDRGAIIIGKTNCDEFAMGASTEASAYKVTKNPWDTKRVPGGSSGGAAASVAARTSVYALGSDTGGSIRQPASFCNVVGLKPTYGRISRYGIMAMASGLDTVAINARTVEDAGIVLEAIAGRDEMDATSVDEHKDHLLKEMKESVKGKKIGVPKEYFGEGLDAEVKAIVEAGMKDLEKLGCELVDISLPHVEYALPVYYIIVPSEVASNMAKYDGIRYGMQSKDAQNLMETYEKSRSEFLGKEVKRRILMGSYALSAGYYDAYYKKAQQVRRLIIEDFQKAFEKVDAIVSPTSPVAPFKIHERMSDPLSMYLSDVYTVAANLAGIPGISLPAGFTKDKLPVGMQLVANQFEEGKLLQIGHAYQESTDWHKEQPDS